MRYTLDDLIQKLESTEANLQALNFGKILINSQGIDPISNISDEDLFRLAQALQRNTSLTTVEIQQISLELLSPLGTCVIGDALKNHPHLKKLKIALDTSGEFRKIIGFLDALTGTAPIEEFHLKVDCCDDAYISAIGDALHQNISLKTIRIDGLFNSDQVLSSQAIQRLTSGIGFEKPLTALHLRFLNLGDAGALALTQECSQLTTLTQLSLCKLSISAVGIRALAPLLIANKDLTELDLSHNPLQLEGIQQLMNALALMPFLRKLKLVSTKLDVAATEYLVRQWRNLKLSISDLNIALNFTRGIKSIYQLIEGNTYLKKLHLSIWEINKEEIKLLLSLIADTNRCHLEFFTTEGAFNHKDHLETLNANNFIVLEPTSFIDSINEANERNKNNISTLHQQRCLNQMVDLAQGYTSPASEKTHFSKLPLDAMFLIMTMLYGKEVKGMDVNLCSFLIFNNFISRRHLISDKKYTPARLESVSDEKKSDIHLWWSKSISLSKDKNSLKQLTFFRHHTHLKVYSQCPEYIMSTEKAEHSEYKMLREEAKHSISQEAKFSDLSSLVSYSSSLSLIRRVQEVFTVDNTLGKLQICSLM